MANNLLAKRPDVGLLLLRLVLAAVLLFHGVFKLTHGIDWMADYRSTIGARPVMAQTSPGEVKAKLPAKPPEKPESFDAIAKDLETIIVPGLSLFQHPRFFGFFPANVSLASVLGDFMSTG